MRFNTALEDHVTQKEKAKTCFSDKFEGVFIQVGEDDPEEDKLVHVDVEGVVAREVVFGHEGEEDGGEQGVPESVRTAAPA